MPSERQKVGEGASRLRLQTAVRLRWVAVLGQLITVGFVSFVLRFPMPVGWCLATISLSAWLNVYLRIRYDPRHRLSTPFATSLLAYDIIQLAVLLYLTGGVENPFAFLIVAPVMVSAASLPPRSTVLLGLIAVFSTGALATYHLPLPWLPAEALVLPPMYKVGIIASVLASMIFLALYAWRLSKESRQMSAALAATEHVLSREQRLHALDGLAAAAAHELGTPLATIAVVTKELERDVPPGSPLADDIALLRSQALRCREILQTLTRKPTEKDPMHSSLSVKQLLREAAGPYLNFHDNIQVNAAPSESAVGPAVIEPVGERRPGVIFGLGNLIENATDFARGQVEITARWTEHEVLVTIADDGPGFTRDVMEALGEPYVTTRPSAAKGANGDATGLGLGFFIAKTLLERSGATLDFANRAAPATGAVITVRWPRAAFIGDVTAEPDAAAAGSDSSSGDQEEHPRPQLGLASRSREL